MLQNRGKVISLIFLLSAIIVLGYFVDRSQTILLFSTFSIAFLAYYTLIKNKACSLKEILIAGIVLRLVLIVATPQLSDDYFRFAFDGEMIVNGENPYTVYPDSLISSSDYEMYLIDNMNSPKYYTVYPPINQICFSMPSFLANQRIDVYVMSLRILIILFEILLASLLLKMLNYFKKDLRLFAWYFLNPLVIMELTGNLHFEGVTMFFFLLAIWLLIQGKWWQSAIVYALSIGTKLIPLMLLPFLMKRLKWKVVRYYIVVTLGLIVLFIPFINSELITKMQSSVGLYFNTFMFNGSVFKVFDWLITSLTSLDYGIGILGKVLPLIVIVSILSMTLLSKKASLNSMLKQSLFALLIYYAFASIVHPWYVINLLVIGLFTNYRFPIVWSLLVVVSYGAYSNCAIGNCVSVSQNNWLVGLEYILLTGYIIYELKREKQLANLNPNNQHIV